MEKKRIELHQSKTSFGVDVVIQNIESNPQCIHGPSILFERYSSSGTSKRFFACSACRDRKKCNFYVEEENIDSFNRNLITKENLYSLKLHWKQYNKYSKVNRIKTANLSYCTVCSTLVINDEKKIHNECPEMINLGKNNFKFPTKFLPPKDDAKCEAQYLFSDKSVASILKILRQVNASKILCIGAPRIHEVITSDLSFGCSSLLLDIDDRFAHFFSPQEYIFYNLFNHHFFGGEEAKNIFSAFLKGDEKLVVVMDPPFGGRMELIKNSLKLIEEEWHECNGRKGMDDSLPVFLIFPYFLESAILSVLPDFTMVDLMVDYDNHPLYTKGPKGMKNGSAVRIFMNLSQSTIDLSIEDGYHNCVLCRRWVYDANVHCDVCGGCMGKDGRTYKHCNKCARCVKPSWIHCDKCKACRQQDHRCSKNANKKLGLCHSCGEEGHKRRDCVKRKGSQDSGSGLPRKKKKHWSATEEKEHVKNILEQVLS